ncbi:methyltransferase domain-containing protein [Fodinicola acaciae]|uniref:methyltransferase domain-containing protein n=1 Tax=Fodinicola acaciae TaxID=2681555 RepID=UPI0013D584BE|nr:methyltransferase domain-containing protein [Fodinicola acaciae]
MTERYTPGWGTRSVSFMADRRLETHGQFFLPHLTPGLRVLDLGCGPGTITVGIGSAVSPGSVVGVDAGAEARTVGNVRFVRANAYELPFEDGSFDRVFSHALLEHLSEPQRVIAEASRVLARGGVIGVCCPAWDGFLLAPPSESVDAAILAYQNLQAANGGDPRAGRKLGVLLAAAGFVDVRLDARYERYVDAGRIAEYLAEQLPAEPAAALLAWSADPAAMFAQAWVCATARKP